MKKKDNGKLKKQLVSGGIYIALAAAVVTVTLNGVNSIIGGNNIEVPETDVEVPEIRLELPEIETDTNSIFVTPNAISPFDETLDNGVSDEFHVSGTSEGIPAETSEENADLNDRKKDEAETETAEENNAESIENSSSEETKSASGEPDDIEYPSEPETYFYGAYAKPADGYIDREFTMDELLYSPTMGDFRTHNGIDITGDIGSTVRAVCGGTVEDVYYDEFYGYTVAVNHGDGVIAYYMNLSEAIPKEIITGAVVSTGQVIGGIGESAAIESADIAHLHFSVKRNGAYIDPGEFLRG